jgi:hypothetical protein
MLLGLGDGQLDAADEVVGAVPIGRGERVAHRCGDHHARSPVDIDRLGKPQGAATARWCTLWPSPRATSVLTTS